MKKLITLFLTASMVVSIFTGVVSADKREVEDFVTRLYNIALDRKPDDAGLEVWTEWLLTDAQCGTSVASGFVCSPEFQNAGHDDATYVNKLYTMLLDRKPEKAGMDYWVDQIKKGASKEEIFCGFANSPEFYELCESYGITAGHYIMGVDPDRNAKLNSFVTQLYNVCLGRSADKAGQEYWVENLYNGTSSGTAAVYGFVYSPEFLKLNTTNEEYITALYRTFLGRNPEENEVKAWKDFLVSKKMSREDVFNGFSVSPEFEGICSYTGIEVGFMNLTPATYTPDRNNPEVTAKPTTKPTVAPTAKPTAAPTAKPTAKPTAAPTAKPTVKPTAAPTTTPVPAKKPITLSGKRSDRITTDDVCYTENDKVRIFFYKGCKVYGDTLDYFTKCLEDVEAVTGLSYMGKQYNSDYLLMADSEVEYFYGDAFKGCPSFDDGKMNVLVVPDEKAQPYSAHNAVIMNQMDLDFEDDLCWAPVHEMVHSVLRSNASYQSHILDEGMASAIANLIIVNGDYFNKSTTKSLDYNYEYYTVILDKSNAEKLYLTEPEDGWDDYLYGYRFANYIINSYGSYEFQRVFAKSKEMYGDVDTLTRAESVKVLKATFGNDVFEKFIDYLYSAEGIERFKPAFDDSKYKITLDGKASSSVKIDKYCYTENDRVRVFFYPGITVPGNYLDYATEVLNTSEMCMGLFLNQYKYTTRGNTLCSGTLSLYYGDNFNIPLDTNDGKLNIYVVDPEIAGACSFMSEITINPMDLDLHDEINITLPHEMIHSIQMTNGINLGTVITEGSATAISRAVSSNSDLIEVPEIYPDFNYSVGFDTVITADNAEKIFRATKEDSWEDYCYGYRFCSYLIELKGTYYLEGLLNTAYEIYGTDTFSITNDQAADIVIKYTGNKNIFKDFAEWVNTPENVYRFSGEEYMKKFY